jgi:hypothetical protein
MGIGWPSATNPAFDGSRLETPGVDLSRHSHRSGSLPGSPPTHSVPSTGTGSILTPRGSLQHQSFPICLITKRREKRRYKKATGVQFSHIYPCSSVTSFFDWEAAKSPSLRPHGGVRRSGSVQPVRVEQGLSTSSTDQLPRIGVTS